MAIKPPASSRAGTPSTSRQRRAAPVRSKKIVPLRAARRPPVIGPPGENQQCLGSALAAGPLRLFAPSQQPLCHGMGRILDLSHFFSPSGRGHPRWQLDGHGMLQPIFVVLRFVSTRRKPHNTNSVQTQVPGFGQAWLGGSSGARSPREDHCPGAGADSRLADELAQAARLYACSSPRAVTAPSCARGTVYGHVSGAKAVTWLTSNAIGPEGNQEGVAIRSATGRRTERQTPIRGSGSPIRPMNTKSAGAAPKARRNP